MDSNVLDEFIKNHEAIAESHPAESIADLAKMEEEFSPAENYSIEQILKHRATKRVPAWWIGKILNTHSFVVAGNSLNRDKPNDFDVYMIGETFDFEKIRHNIEHFPSLRKKCSIICETKNSMTVKIDGYVTQFCKYTKNSVMELIKSFDFAHCQVAAEFHCCDLSDDYDYFENLKVSVSKVYFTEDWVKAKVNESTFYTGSEYPLSSLIRLVKYAQRGMFAGGSYKYEMLKIFKDIINRGYKDYEDYKDQLDSIDLMLLTEENMGGLAFELYKDLKDKGLVLNG